MNERLANLVNESKRLKGAIEYAEEQLKSLNTEYRAVTETYIPALMSELGIETARLEDGTSISVSADIKASITQENQEAAFKWLNDNGHGGCIKTVTKTAVHPQTLMALMRELLESGVDVPLDKFSIFKYNKTSIR